MAARGADRNRSGALSRLRVRLTPAGGADRIDGRAADADGHLFLKVRVRAAPENNEANRALKELVAKAFGVAKSNVEIVRGASARLKTLEVEGVSDAEIAAFMTQFEEA